MELFDTTKSDIVSVGDKILRYIPSPAAYLKYTAFAVTADGFIHTGITCRSRR